MSKRERISLPEATVLRRTEPVVVEELGPDLDQRQTLAVVLSATTDMTHDEIAAEADYAQGSAVSRFLASDRGRAGVEWAVRRHLLEAGRVGLQTMLLLAKGAKSENVRQMAAADLLNRARIGLEAGTSISGGGGVSGITISINTGLASDPAMVTISPE